MRIEFPKDLPVSAQRSEIERALSEHPVIVVAGATGSGKTTQIPKIALSLGRTRIAHTQPRRIAARAVAERLAAELGVELGLEVGYRVRFTDESSPNSLITVMTDGILLNRIRSDPHLLDYDTIIIDEAHERSLNIDFLLGYLKRIRPHRPDLKVIITSATIDPESFARHFDNAPVIEVSGRTFPIEIRYRPLGAERLSSDDPDDSLGTESHTQEQLVVTDYLDGIISALNELSNEAPGDVLVFLSGEAEIRDARDALMSQVDSGFLTGTEVLPLYGRLSSAEQHRVFESTRLPGIRRRVILATNVAETSITVPGIRYVIDTGLARISRFSSRAKVQRLPIEAISQASANQRSGRCGRLSDGIAIRLYSQEDFDKRPEFTDPEILRTNLASVILQAASLGISDIADFPFLMPPDEKGIRAGRDLLSELGAIEATARGVPRLTSIGREMAKLPIEPRFARMVLESRRRHVEREVLIIVSGLAVADPRERPAEHRERAHELHARFADPTSDFLSLLNLWNYLEEQRHALSSSAFRRLCKAEFLHYLRVREWSDVYGQLVSLARPMGIKPGAPSINPDGIHRALLSGLLSQIGIRADTDSGRSTTRRSPRSQRPTRITAEFLGSRNSRFVIFPGSTLAKKPPAAVMSAELVETSRLFARMNAAISPEWAEDLGGDLCRRSVSEPHWERSQASVVAYERVTLFGVPIVVRRRIAFAKIDPAHARELFIRHALVDGEWDSPQAFDAQNRALREELADLEERTRQRDLFVDEERVFDFYNARIPADVFSTRTFEGWWRRARIDTPELLTMTREDIIGGRVDAPELDENLFPSNWVWGPHRLSVSYRFEPGHPDDGVTLDVPLEILPAMTPETWSWHVPGLRHELATVLIKTLPKPLRKLVVPAGEWATRALDRLPKEPSGDFVTALANALSELARARISPDDFDLSRVAAHLKINFRVSDSRHRVLATGRSLKDLQGELAGATREALAALTSRTHALERDVTTFDVDSFEQTVENNLGTHSVLGYPTLVPPTATSPTTRLRVLATESGQRSLHPLGLRSLVRAQIPSPAKYVLEHLTANERLALSATPYPSASALIDDAINACIDRVMRTVRADGCLFTRHEFEMVRDRVQGVLMDSLFDTVSLVTRIVAGARDARRAIDEAASVETMSVLSSEVAHLEELLCPRFISRTGLARLPRVLVYLRAITERVTRLRENAGRDATSAREVTTALTIYSDAGGHIPLPEIDIDSVVNGAAPTPCALDANDPLTRARWAIEELRVSLFAQQLGTSEPVSLQRIKKMLS